VLFVELIVWPGASCAACFPVYADPSAVASPSLCSRLVVLVCEVVRSWRMLSRWGGADLTCIVGEEGKYRLEERCVYASVSSATFVRNLWDR